MNAGTTIRVSSSGKTRALSVADPSPTLADLLAANGFPLNTRCNQRGLCRGCAVVIEGGSFIDTRDNRAVSATEPIEVLGCRCRAVPGGELEVRIPGKSLLSHPPAVVSDFRIDVPTGCDPIFAAWESRPLGVAVDIGTTTVALLLAELASGKILARASGLNAQVRHGDNVLTRIHLCQTDKANIAMLRDAFWKETFRPLLKELLQKAGVDIAQVAGVCVAGNTTMLHLAADEDPTPLGMVPFTPRFLDQRRLDSQTAGLPAGSEVILLPGMSAYVGADIAAGAVCCGSQYGERPCLLVDVGTNGEILLTGPQSKLACATAAGPAFEGCGLTCGMRAADGVVERIQLDENPFAIAIRTIGEKRGAVPHGIAGSAYVDFLAEGRHAGLLESNGRFSSAFVEKNPAWFSREESGLGLILSPEHPHLRITEVDVALLLQAKSAIAAGVLTLLERQQLQPGDIERVFLAGGFGLHLSVPHAIACGILPGFAASQIEPVGNTSLGGAYLAMLDRTLVDEMNALCDGVETVELNLDPGFEDRYVDHLALL